MNRERNRDNGAILVTFLLSIIALVLIISLAIEAFRLMTTRLQLQNTAEYIAQYRLADIVANRPYLNSQTEILNTLASNAAIGILKDNSNPPVISRDTACSSDFCLLDGCTVGVEGGEGTFINRSDDNTNPTCQPSEKLAVTVRIKTGNYLRFYSLLAQVLNIQSLNVSGRAISYVNQVDGKTILTTGPYYGSVED
jgi:Flp pilus assembly protein TadG